VCRRRGDREAVSRRRPALLAGNMGMAMALRGFSFPPPPPPPPKARDRRYSSARYERTDTMIYSRYKEPHCVHTLTTRRLLCGSNDDGASSARRAHAETERTKF